MEIWDNDDYETAIEEYPGYLGSTWDGELAPGPHLAGIGEFDWLTYMELVEGEGSHVIHVELTSGSLDIEFEAYDDLAFILDYLPSINVLRDTGNPDGGPASGSGYVFFLADGATIKGLEAEISALIDVLKTDFAVLKSKSAKIY